MPDSFRLRTHYSSRHGSRARRGYSLVELIVALTLIAIIGGIAIPKLDYERYRAEAAMRYVRQTLQGAQRNSIMRQTNVVVGFSTTGNTIAVLEDANNNCAADAGERLIVTHLGDGSKFAMPPVGFSATPPTSPINGLSLCMFNGYRAVQFMRDGAASSDVDIYVTSSRGTAVNFRLLHITQATGRTDAYRYDGSAWVRTN